MLTTIEGIYENGTIVLNEKPAIKKRVKVFVMFTDEKVEENIEVTTQLSKQLRGAWKNASAESKEEIKNYFDNVRNEWEKDI